MSASVFVCDSASAANRILNAVRAENLPRLESELELWGSFFRRAEHLPGAEAERAELLAAVIDQMRTSLDHARSRGCTRFEAAEVCLGLLLHLARQTQQPTYGHVN